MEKHFYFFLVLVLFQPFFAQKTKNLSEEIAIIDKKLDETANSSNLDYTNKQAIFFNLKAESERLNYDEGIFRSVSFLMSTYEEQNKNKEIIELGNEIKEKFINYKKDNTGLITSIYRRNAIAFGYLGLDDLSRKDLKLALKYANTIDDEDKKNYVKGMIYQNFTMYFSNHPNNGKKDRDSILYYLNKSLETTIKIKNTDGFYNNIKPQNIAFTKMRLAIFYLEQATVPGSLEKAEKYLWESHNIYFDKKYNILPYDKVFVLNQLSWLYMEKKDYKKSIDFANQSLELEKKYKDPSNRMESFEFLATGYIETGDKEKAKLYMSKYTNLKDSLNMSLRNDADTSMKKIINSVEDKHNKSFKKQLIITGIAALILGIGVLFLWKRKNKILQTNYEKMIQNLQNSPIEIPEENDGKATRTPKSENPASNKNTISNETETRILRDLLKFEKSRNYLNKNFTISLLASQLNTNSKYLSEIIKNHRTENFNHYINGLRINYIVNKLYGDPKYREYKISYLAKESGFSSPQVFVLAFKKINGVTPSYFIQRLKDDKDSPTI